MSDVSIFEKRTAKRLLRNERKGVRSLLDQVKQHYLDNTPLSKEAQDYMRILEAIKERKVQGAIDSDIRDYIRTEFNLTKGEIYRAMVQALELYGDLMSVKKQGYRAVLAERYEILASKALERFELTSEAEWLKLYREALDSIAKLHMLHQADDDAPRVRRRVIIQYTSDPGSLKAEEVDYDDISEEEQDDG